MKTVICFSNRSSKTGKAFADEFMNHSELGRIDLVRSSKRVRDAKVFIRWGNCVSWCPDNALVLNSPTAVNNASNKSKMIQLLSSGEGVTTPKFFMRCDMNNVNVNDYKNEDGFFYIRGSNLSVRYDNVIRNDDLYIMKPIKTKREYRVHVFNGKILGIYEKIPREEGVKLFKAHNCQFKRLDPEICTLKERGKKMAIDAVAKLGLLFGGVDVIKNEANEYVINEVNSAPSLNSINVKRWTEEIKAYIKEKTTTGV